ncbi:mpv17-like protein 2 [Aplysia californica]|uniref:Mpv17-like protein 2 n=1 Tax=Aplysia californica TaxID=6500 RepID=A0ABM0JV38_APLCA|nr:mpv17-like protein 2 [Aplysia californica]XP_035826630.1 mpv17-like protein 2 [Aplysia californica]XP_035826631.1 mpv17-like protein 2 [Aplysia californica]
MTTFTRIRVTFEKLYGKHLLATNIVTCGTLLGVGDCMVQRMNIAYEKHNGNTVKYDFARTGRMVAIGFVLGPFNHYWYTFLDRILKGTSQKTVLKKIACDQTVAGPFFCTSFLVGMTLLEGKGLDAAIVEWKNKFLHIYMVDWMFWPLAQFVNFRFLPGRFRVLYVSSATLIWNSFLSYMKHRSDDETEEAVEEAHIR